jgi:hypothetical protein
MRSLDSIFRTCQFLFRAKDTTNPYLETVSRALGGSTLGRSSLIFNNIGAISGPAFQAQAPGS